MHALVLSTARCGTNANAVVSRNLRIGGICAIHIFAGVYAEHPKGRPWSKKPCERNPSLCVLFLASAVHARSSLYCTSAFGFHTTRHRCSWRSVLMTRTVSLSCVALLALLAGHARGEVSLPEAAPAQAGATELVGELIGDRIAQLRAREGERTWQGAQQLRQPAARLLHG
jgi:hypothetical protein